MGRKKLRKVALTVLLVIIAVIFIFPLLLTVSNSFMSEGEIEENYSAISIDSGLSSNNTGAREFVNLKLIPDEVVLKQYYTVLVKRIQFLFMFWNSVIIVVPIIAGQIAVGSLAAYAFGKLRFKWREQLFFIYIVVMLMPFQVTLVPNYIVADRLGLIGDYRAIILPGIFSTFGVFLLRQFMSYVPDQYIEAAKIDGAGHFYVFSRIVLPMVKTGLAALAILVFIDNWNMVEQPVIFLQDAMKLPLSVYLSDINRGAMGVAFAASTIYMLPIILVFLYGENYLVEGIQLSGIKG